MPGFMVGGSIGGHTLTAGGFTPGGTPSNAHYYHTYHWEVSNVFNEFIAGQKYISLKECGLPTISIEKETYKGSFVEYKYAKSVTFEDVTMSFYDSYGLLDKINQWYANVFDENAGIAAASVYKKNSSITVSLPEAGSNSTQVYWLYGCWPSSVKYGDLTYTSSDVKVVDLTLTYDYCRYGIDGRFQPFGGGGGGGGGGAAGLGNLIGGLFNQIGGLLTPR